MPYVRGLLVPYSHILSLLFISLWVQHPCSRLAINAASDLGWVGRSLLLLPVKPKSQPDSESVVEVEVAA